jgi:hypothetical protein
MWLPGWVPAKVGGLLCATCRGWWRRRGPTPGFRRPRRWEERSRGRRGGKSSHSWCRWSSCSARGGCSTTAAVRGFLRKVEHNSIKRTCADSGACPRGVDLPAGVYARGYGLPPLLWARRQPPPLRCGELSGGLAPSCGEPGGRGTPHWCMLAHLRPPKASACLVASRSCGVLGGGRGGALGGGGLPSWCVLALVAVAVASLARAWSTGAGGARSPEQLHARAVAAARGLPSRCVDEGLVCYCRWWPGPLLSLSGVWVWFLWLSGGERSGRDNEEKR